MYKNFKVGQYWRNEAGDCIYRIKTVHELEDVLNKKTNKITVVIAISLSERHMIRNILHKGFNCTIEFVGDECDKLFELIDITEYNVLSNCVWTQVFLDQSEKSNLLQIALDLHMMCTGASEIDDEFYERFICLEYALDKWIEGHANQQDFDSSAKKLIQSAYNEAKKFIKEIGTNFFKKSS